MPFQRERYPANWPEISLQIREREGWRCKWCGAENGKPHPLTKSKVVLTVAHLGVPKPDGTPGDTVRAARTGGTPVRDGKHDKTDVRDENLAALCQRCHLNYDLDEHMQNAARKRRKKIIAAGQLELGLPSRPSVKMLFKCIDPARNMYRWYSLSVQPTLFDSCAVICAWGRIRTSYQRIRILPADSVEEAEKIFG
ncbi:MAG: WGR domain-containing protein [Chloroflexota bacterium]